MEYLKIRNWDKWQSYRKDRGQPPWVKVHRSLLRDWEWMELTDEQRGQLVAMWLLAADRNGVIPASPQIIKKMCHMSSDPDIELFIKHGFIVSDANVTPTRQPSDAPEEVRGGQRRSEKKGNGAKRATPPRKAFPVTEDLAKWADENQIRINLKSETEKFLDYYRGNGKSMKDWTATWRNWMRRAASYNTTTPGERPPLQEFQMLERHIIASLLQDNSLISECPLTADDFIEDSHRTIFQRIQQMALARQPFDVVTLGTSLQETTGDLGWLAMLGEMVQELASTANFQSYIEVVREQARKRKATSIGLALADSGDHDAAIRRLMALEDVQQRGGKVIDAVTYALDGIDRTMQGGKPGVITGITDLDEKLGGFHKSDLVVIGARSSMGKTAFMLNLANASNVPVGIISAEQGMEQLGQRFLAINGRVSVHRMRNGKLEDEDWPKLTQAVTAVQSKEIYINDKPNISLVEIQRQCRAWKHRNNIGVIYVDYIQKISGTKQEKRHEVSEIVIGLKNIAREIEVPVVALAQVSRDVDRRGNKRPFMSDLSESKVIEEESDQVMTLYRDEVYNQDTSDKGVMEINICKNRHGPLGMIKTTWLAEYMQVKDYIEMWGRT